MRGIVALDHTFHGEPSAIDQFGLSPDSAAYATLILDAEPCGKDSLT